MQGRYRLVSNLVHIWSTAAAKGRTWADAGFRSRVLRSYDAGYDRLLARLREMVTASKPVR
jgi:hypothetical protein